MSVLIKQLTKSDRTIFKEFFIRNLRQMAIVLPKVYMRQFKYEFGEISQGLEYSVDVNFYAPDTNVPLIKKNAAICRHSKDWRLHKCLIAKEDYNSRNFSQIEIGDIIIIKWDGEKNGVVQCAFLSNKFKVDKEIISKIGHVSRNKVFSNSEFNEFLKLNKLVENKRVIPLLNAENINIEDSLQGGVAGIAMHESVLSYRELEKKLLLAKKTGDDGEKIFDNWLKTFPEINGHQVKSHEWISKINAVSPFDFQITFDSNQTFYVELKSTKGEFSNLIYISRKELETMANNKVFLCRLYDLENAAKLRFLCETSDVARKILDNMSYSKDIKFVSIEVSPNYFNFSNEVLEIDTF